MLISESSGGNRWRGAYFSPGVAGGQWRAIGTRLPGGSGCCAAQIAWKKIKDSVTYKTSYM